MPYDQPEVLGGIHRVSADPAQMSDLEKKHVPVIHVAASSEPDNYDVTVVVGEHMRHPNEPAHWIDWIELRSGDNLLARFDLAPVVAEPTATITLYVPDAIEITAVEHCNIHGTWGAAAMVGAA